MEQRRVKMEALSAIGIQGMYYVSHAPFLFAVCTKQTLKELKGFLVGAGIPESRIEDVLQTPSVE